MLVFLVGAGGEKETIYKKFFRKTVILSKKALTADVFLCGGSMSRKHKKTCIAITGTLEAMSHNEAVKALHMAGLNYAISINRTATHCVIASNPRSEEVMSAHRHDLVFMDEDEFLQLVAENKNKS